jgi:hypothetical protein
LRLSALGRISVDIALNVAYENRRTFGQNAGFGDARRPGGASSEHEKRQKKK